jgi:hypothetical protein
LADLEKLVPTHFQQLIIKLHGKRSNIDSISRSKERYSSTLPDFLPQSDRKPSRGIFKAAD